MHTPRSLPLYRSPPEAAAALASHLERFSSRQSPLLVPRRLHPAIRPGAWARLLDTHPDKAFSSYSVNGIKNGFRIGFNRCQPLGAVTRNMSSASAQQAVVTAYIDNEVTLGRLVGPLPPLAARHVHRNRIGVVPKGHTPGKWRLITDLSFPPDRSVNDGIDPSLCSLSYVSIDTVAAIVASLGAGSLIAKIDIESAYRLVPVSEQILSPRRFCPFRRNCPLPLPPLSPFSR